VAFRWFESGRGHHFGTKLGSPRPAVFAAEAATSVRRNTLFEPMMRTSFRLHIDALCQGAEVAAAITARVDPHAPAGLAGDRF
jgi:hypothetical protein